MVKIGVRSACAGALAAVGLLCPGLASAQWEGIYGATPSADSGARGTAPIRFCPGGGFISTGTQQVAGVGSNVFVVRTTPLGATAFERIYDIGGVGASDRGTSIVELRGGTGFVVAGSSTVGGTEDAFLLRIDCAGNVVWGFTYGGPSRDAALDVTEAQTGNPAAGTSPGDLVATGYTTNPVGGNPDGLLFRVRSNGALLWSRRYDVNSVSESFAALTETRPLGAALTGDLVAVGSWRSAGADQGYVIRVNGDTGLFTVPNACAAIYGGADPERFTSVVESRAGATVGNLAISGVASSAANGNDIYLVRTQPNPCVPLAQRRIGAPLGAANIDDETAADIDQLAAGIGIGPLGSFVLTGAAGKSGTTNYDAYLLSVNASTLVPFTGRLFGDHMTRRDEGTSLFDMSTLAGPGIIIGGSSASDFQGVGDTRDLYLIRTDVTGDTSCRVGWVPPSVAVGFGPTSLSPTIASVLTPVARPVSINGQVTAYQACP